MKNEKKICRRKFVGLLPNCNARKGSVLQERAVWLGKKLYCNSKFVLQQSGGLVGLKVCRNTQVVL